MILWVAVTCFLSCSSETDRKADHAENEFAHSPLKDSLPENPTEMSKAGADTTKYLFEIEGLYKLTDTIGDCKMELRIFRNKKQFNYQLKTATRQWQGDVLLSFNEKKDGYYITLKGIEWSEYEGVVDPDEQDEQPEEEKALPQEVQGVLYNNEITIQNTGNSMNYYVKFGDCDLKYIHLIKRAR
ncbi:hypothetical protein [Niabella hibiscisoli]|uniref:hypothetical protein n=1 Tax=Niabella hibiscisoli TaxID=1825928 RepID=UPI001F0FC614|nr:hypothetical protein [Niabella hibiscisoli]MCH5720093.1 hypothetical protein [Niabella hibiscisoli]